MGINFYRRTATSRGQKTTIEWAETVFGSIVPGAEPGAVIYIKKPVGIEKELILKLDIPDLDRESIEAVAEAILRKKLPLNPSATIDSQLYTVVNEAIHKLEEIKSLDE